MSELPPDGPGLYFLIADETIIYVGSSLWPSRRVWSHVHAGKEFDCEVYLAVEDADLIRLERLYIGLLTPRHNRAGNPVPSLWAAAWG